MLRPGIHARLETLFEAVAALGQRLVTEVALADPNEIEHIQRCGLNAVGEAAPSGTESPGRAHGCDAGVAESRAELPFRVERDDLAVNDDGAFAEPSALPTEGFEISGN